MDRDYSPLIACTVSGTTYTLYECPANCKARVPLVFIVNANGTVTINFKIYKAATTTSYFILGGKNLALGEYIQLSDSYIILQPGDRLELTCTGAAVNVDALCTVQEIFKPVGK